MSSREKRDIFYRQAKSEGWRARSAFKLLHIDEEFNIFENVTRVVDLCAAPGSWSQVLTKNIKPPNGIPPVIVAVDLQKMAPISGVTQLQGDITKQSTADAIIGNMHGELADLVVCDGAPDVTGLHDMDEFIQAQLLLAALNITAVILKPGGTFVAKIFRGKNAPLLSNQLKLFFEFVTISKPRSSRNSSIEAFIVCQNFKMPECYTPSLANPFLNVEPTEGTLKDLQKGGYVAPFVTCGSLSGFDSDATYEAPKEGTLPAVQEPLEPPYANFLNWLHSS
ncbi:putative tRNA (cytidine(32)/guanosine(34)-2'-O)-methyltransferase [Chytridiales sp. JEL 0842]|nr:putative tRNA (cytidine(32)/guanosine(34)-2'-O)-methyltransferase [Chytridiales sp. JEL 0842]